jgi:hypothetical protein
MPLTFGSMLIQLSFNIIARLLLGGTRHDSSLQRQDLLSLPHLQITAICCLILFAFIMTGHCHPQGGANRRRGMANAKKYPYSLSDRFGKTTQTMIFSVRSEYYLFFRSNLMTICLVSPRPIQVDHRAVLNTYVNAHT